MAMSPLVIGGPLSSLPFPKSKRAARQEAASQGRCARCDGALLKECKAIRTSSQDISFCLPSVFLLSSFVFLSSS
jgi:hypothetical protein